MFVSHNFLMLRTQISTILIRLHAQLALPVTGTYTIKDTSTITDWRDGKKSKFLGFVECRRHMQWDSVGTILPIVGLIGFALFENTFVFFSPSHTPSALPALLRSLLFHLASPFAATTNAVGL